MHHREAVIVPTDEAIRAYVRARRKVVKLTQEAVAAKIYLPHSTYRDWESGSTQEMKARPFACIISVLKIPMTHIRALGNPDADPSEVRNLANEPVTAPPPNSDLDEMLINAYNRKQGDGHAEQRLQIAQLAQQLIDRPDLLNDWLHYGEFLLHKR
jgi:transcriptional regulator with XRE-family HTH domain